MQTCQDNYTRKLKCSGQDCTSPSSMQKCQLPYYSSKLKYVVLSQPTVSLLILALISDNRELVLPPQNMYPFTVPLCSPLRLISSKTLVINLFLRCSSFKRHKGVACKTVSQTLHRALATFFNFNDFAVDMAHTTQCDNLLL